jgi:hypothetical protein
MEDPELAVLSAMGHARDPDTAKSARIAMLAQMAAAGLDANRSMLYCDLILRSLPEAARRALRAMDIDNYEFKSDFARKYIRKGMKLGKAEGKAEGRMEIILKQLAKRYGALSEAIEARVRSVGSAELDEVAERLLTAGTVEEALGMVNV